jgi:hypothetical protein
MGAVGVIRCQQVEDICPRKRAASRAQLIGDRGTENIAFVPCISKGNPIGMACPNLNKSKMLLPQK